MKVNGIELTPEFVNVLMKYASFTAEFNPFEAELSYIDRIREMFCNTLMDHETEDTLRLAEYIAGLTMIKNTLTELGNYMPLKPASDE